MLYLLPDELLVAIVGYCDQKTRKHLSLVSRRLRHLSQFIIFKTVHISRHKFETVVPRFAVEGDLPEVMQNDRLVSYIQTLVISLDEAFQHLEVNTIELLFTALHKMRRLRDIELLGIPFTTTMLDQLCEVLSTRLYNVNLRHCLYPADYTIKQPALKIQRLSLVARLNWKETAPFITKAFVAIIQKALSSITSLSMASGVGVLASFGTLPRLTSLDLLSKSGINDEGLSKFLVANPQLVEFALGQPIKDLSFLPPSALPNLRTIRASVELVQHLLPGCPVSRVEVTNLASAKIMLDGLRALSRSAAPIVKLNLHLHHYFIHFHEMLDIVVKAVPSLERMWLSFRAEVRSTLRYTLACIDHSFLAVASTPRSPCQTRLTARGQFTGSCLSQAMG